jgi:hypothetical protein
MPAPGDDPTAMRIRGEAYRVWRSVSVRDKEKEGWKDLQKTRHSDPNVFKNGLKLLKKQGLLTKLKANCQHIVNTAAAPPSESAPARSEPAKASAVASRDAPNIKQPSCPPAPALLENASAAHPRRKDIANLRGSSDRSYSPPEFILSQHILSKSKPVTLPSCKDTSDAQSHSNESNPLLDIVRSEQTAVAHPRCKDAAFGAPELMRPERTSTNRPKSRNKASPRITLDRSSSPSSPATLTEHTTKQQPRSGDDARSISTSGQSSPSSPKPTPPEQTTATHPKSMDDASAESTSDQSSSEEEEERTTFPEPTSTAHSISKDCANVKNTSDQPSSPPMQTISEHTSAAHSGPKKITWTKIGPMRSSSHQEPAFSKDMSVKNWSSNSTAGSSPASIRSPSAQLSAHSERTSVVCPIPNVSNKGNSFPTLFASFPR